MGADTVRILCTFPGKFGDLLWALPTVRALSRRIGEPVHLAVGSPFASITSLIEAQPYIRRCWNLAAWEVQYTAPMTPTLPPATVYAQPIEERYDHVFHLGYRGWPALPLPMETMACLQQQLPDALGPITLQDLDLSTPWITEPAPPAPRRTASRGIAVGFTDEHFELKYGLTALLGQHRQYACTIGADPRWINEGGRLPRTWEASVRILQDSRAFLGCNSALHVLAVAVGIPVVMMEPNPHRHHDIFYPLGRTGPQVTLVTGNDGLPTFDARHVRAALDQVLLNRRQ